MPAATQVDGFGVTEDGRTLVQLNFGGQLHFYDVASGNIILRGYHIDGELIVYDQRGYYTASPEGSQFIFLKFPGLPGYNALHQFARTLKRPDLIEAILAGKGAPPDPRLTPPATLELAVDVAGSPAGRSARLRVAASAVVGLEKLRIFIDGAAAAEHPLAGRSATADITLPLKPEARWVTVVAVDKAGYESVAQGAALPGATKAAGSRLFAIADRHGSIRRQGQYHPAESRQDRCLQVRRERAQSEGNDLRLRRGDAIPGRRGAAVEASRQAS